MFVFQMAGLYSEFVEVGNVGFSYRALSITILIVQPYFSLRLIPLFVRKTHHNDFIVCISNMSGALVVGKKACLNANINVHFLQGTSNQHTAFLAVTTVCIVERSCEGKH